MPTADAAEGLEVELSGAPIPPAGAARVAFPLTRYATAAVEGALVAYPTLAGASASLRFHLWRPTGTQWGAAVQLQSLGFVHFTSEPRSGLVNALAVAVSTPVWRTRLHLSAGLHTQPGGASDPETGESYAYDVAHPQVMLAAAAEHRFEDWGIFAEALWLGVGAHGGEDSHLLATLGASFQVRQLELRTGLGLFRDRVGRPFGNLYPIPPVLLLRLPL